MILSYIQIFRKSLCIISDFFIEPDLHPCLYTLCSSSVGQSIVYQLADIRGMALWYDKFGVLGLSAGPIQQAITAAGTFMLKASELQQSVVFMSLFRGEITPFSSSYNISGLVPACWLLFQCF